MSVSGTADVTFRSIRRGSGYFVDSKCVADTLEGKKFGDYSGAPFLITGLMTTLPASKTTIAMAGQLSTARLLNASERVWLAPATAFDEVAVDEPDEGSDAGVSDVALWHALVPPPPLRPHCPAESKQSKRPIDPALKKRDSKAAAYLCTSAAGVSVYEYGIFGNGILEHETTFENGDPRTHRTFWPNGKPRTFRSFDAGKPVVEICNGLDESEVTCGLFPFGTSSAADTSIASKVPKAPPGSKSIRFPFGLETITHRSALAADEETCLGKSEHGTTYCTLTDAPSRSLEVEGFVAGGVSVRWTDTPDGQLLEDVTISSTELDDCDDMASAFSSAVALLTARYGNSGKIERGPLFGSKKCRDYMNEGNAYYRVAGPMFRVKADAYFTDGHYTVYLSFSLIPVANVSSKLLQRQKSLKTWDALQKL